jgi:hypothetical protein
MKALPDHALLEIFDFYLSQANQAEAWCTLVHVCRRWRIVVFSSPRRLNLRLTCTPTTPVSKMLDIWPTLPIVVETPSREPPWPWNWNRQRKDPEEKAGNIVAALKHRDRVCQVTLCNLSFFLLDMITGMMQESFPALTYLELQLVEESALVLADSFLGGYAPRLQSLTLQGIPIPALPKLLMSTHDLIDLRLLFIPHSGYISPEAMVTCLSSLTRLELFYLGFRSPQSRPHQSSQISSSLTRIDLVALTNLFIHGASEYVEDFVARINAPLLQHIGISFFNRLLFDIPQLTQFVGRLEQFKECHQAAVKFWSNFAFVVLSALENTVDGVTLVLYVSCSQSEWQLSSLTEVCTSPLPLSSLERLDVVEEEILPGHWPDDTEDAQWLELFRPFIAVKVLYLSAGLAVRVARALQELDAERATEVLPALQSVFIEVSQLRRASNEGMSRFITARRLSGHPVAIYHWER